MKWATLWILLLCYALPCAQDTSGMPANLQGFETATTENVQYHFLWQAAFKTAQCDAPNH